MIRLRAIWRRWRAESILYCLLVALAVAVVLTAAGHRWLEWPWWVGVMMLIGCFCLALWVFPVWRMSDRDVASYLDRRLPELEESCELLLRPAEELGGLERLQVGRVEQRLSALTVLPKPIRGRLLRAAGFVAMGVLASWVICWVRVPVTVRTAGVLPPAVREVAPVGVRSVLVRITPPAYTGRVVRSQGSFSLEVEEGARVSWEVETIGVVDTVAFIFNDTAVRVLRREGGAAGAAGAVGVGGGRWSFSAAALHPGFYQVRVGGQLSALYRFEVVKDEPPKVRILRPRSYTMIDYGSPTRVPLEVELTDDYGIAGSSVFATVSSGKGEAVKFKEQELHWDRVFSGGKNYLLSRVLDLPALGLKPGDELYFYCIVRDNHGQEARSDMYIIALADTAQLMSLEGMTVPTDVKPEFFRSERQIIIETEQLLKAKDTIGLQAFKDKSNDLGMDQKLLRLRYGKFLGEEAEEGDRGGIDTAGFGEFGDATKILDVYSDKHDNAEDATFLEPAVKAQLRGTLSEMWKAELQFRVNKPREALPFCYKALRLLKELQQQSRVYVAKTGVRLTPLNPDKRLTGELGAIVAPVQRLARVDEVPEEDLLRMGLAVLEGMRVGMPLGEGDRMVLRSVERRLGREASARPGRFLAGYEGVKRLTGVVGTGVVGTGVVGTGVATGDVATLGVEMDILAAEKAIGLLLPMAEERPGVRSVAADGGLGRLYFQFLK